MHYLSKYVTMSFQDALAATKEALRRNQFAILAEIDMRKASRRHLALESPLRHPCGLQAAISGASD